MSDMTQASVTTAEAQYVGGSSNKRYVGHGVVQGRRAFVVIQYGPRGKTCQFKVEEASAYEAGRMAEHQVYSKTWERGYEMVEQDIRFTVDLPPLRAGNGKGQSGVAALAEAYEQARRQRYAPALQAIAASVTAAGPRRLVALSGFSLEARSEPVAAALQDIAGVVPSYVAKDGRAVFALPAAAVDAMKSGYRIRPVVAENPVDGNVSAAVLETLLTLWTPTTSGELASLDNAYSTAVLLAG
jgi:hypothetical protein